MKEYPKCEICGEKSTNAVRDIERTIRYTKHDNIKPLGGWHYYCNEHKRDSVTVDIVERIMGL